METIKLIIWDLDETFWHGTLSEGDVTPVKKNIELVKSLTDRGIMNSIVSKNDYSKAKEQLIKFGVWEYFIFPKISWESKGKKVKQLLESCNLRDVNTLFIDDNETNLAEVKFYNEGINVALPSFLEEDLLCRKEFLGKDDKKHTRLQQYKNLEKRKEEENKYSSNVEFLKSSGIRILVKHDCENHKERVLELIQRTNQLNFTKNRLSMSELEILLKDNSKENAYVCVKDNFGDYGIAGFYTFDKTRCVILNFLFSCRILGLGVEKYLYKKLGSPKIEIVGDVAIDINSSEVVDWITETEEDTISLTKEFNNQKILMVSGCDLQQADFYLSSRYSIDKEFATVVEGKEVRTSDLTQLVNSYRLSEDDKDELCKNIPFFDEGITFKSKIFSGQYDYIILSVVDDFIRGVYKHKEKDICITFFGYFDQDVGLSSFTDEEKRYLLENFDYLGAEKPEFFEKNLREVLNKIFDSNSRVQVLLINGIDLDVSEWIGKERCERITQFNNIVDKVVDDYQNVSLIDMRTLVTDKRECIKKDNRHFSRIVYYRMANTIASIINIGQSDKKLYVKNRILKALFIDIRIFIRRFFRI